MVNTLYLVGKTREISLRAKMCHTGAEMCHMGVKKSIVHDNIFILIVLGYNED